MRFYQLLTFTVFSLLVAPGIAGAEGKRLLQLDLRETLRLAVERNLALRQAANEVERSSVTVERERAGFYPDLAVSVSGRLQTGNTFDQTTARLSSERSTSLGADITSRLNLFNGFADIAALNIARKNAQANHLNYERAVETTLLEGAVRYFEVALNRDLVTVQLENRNAQASLLQRIQALQEAGNVSRVDLLQQEAAVAQAERSLVSAQRAYGVAILQLKQHLKLGPFEDVELQPSEDDAKLEATLSVTAPTEILVRKALQNRTDIEAQMLRLDAAQASIRLAKSGWYPTLGLSLGAGTGYSSRSEISPFSEQVGKVNPSGTAALTLSVPLFDRRQTRTAVALAEIESANQRIAIEALTQQVSLGIEQSALDVQAAEAESLAAEAQKFAAKEALAAMEARYEVGAAILTEVLQARAVYHESATQHAVATWRLAALRIVLAAETGTLYSTLIHSPFAELLP